MEIEREESATVSRRGRWCWHAGTVAVALLGLLCLDHTRRTLSGTFDESNHLAAGLEWWQFGTYTMWTENPPLSRIAIAALPYWHGMRLPPRPAWDPKTHEWDRSWVVGNDMLYAGDGFENNLSRARLGTLPFFLLALGAVWGLAGGRRRPGAGLIAVALTATLPALIAHGALATTDVAFVGTFLLAVLALWRWYAAPRAPRALALGAAVGLALLAKFSVLVFFPFAIGALALARRIAARAPARPARDGVPLGWPALARQVALAALAGGLVTWAGYRFSIGRIDDLTPEVKGWLQLLPPITARHGISGWLMHARLPMPELIHGLRFLAAHDADGHDAYLLGRVADHGFIGFYPVALLVKTPLPFLALLLGSLALLARRAPALAPAQAAAFTALGILAVALAGHVNLGIRHVFVLLPLLAVAIGRTLDEAWQRRRGWYRHPRAAVAGAIVAGGLLAAQSGIAIGARATELGYFNALAGADPAAILLDSDLDWGQDLFLLRREARARQIDTLKIAFFGTLRLCQHDLPPLQALEPAHPATGWIAISENFYRNRNFFTLLKNPCDPASAYHDREVPAQPFAWLNAMQPVAIVGSSIRLYHLAAGPPPR